MHLLATVRPPTRDEASPAYRDRVVPQPADLERLVRVAMRDDDEIVHLEIEAREIRVLVDDDADEDDDEQMDTAAAVRALRAAQVATCWYVFGELEDGFESAGDCPHCSTEVFAWQKDGMCPACGESLAPLAPKDAKAAARGEAAIHEATAETLVDTMLANEWIELVTASSRKALIRDVASFLLRRTNGDLAVGARAPAAREVVPPGVSLDALSPGARAAIRGDAAASTAKARAARAARAALVEAAPKNDPGFELLDWLTDLPYIAEVFADEGMLATLLVTSRASLSPDRSPASA